MSLGSSAPSSPSVWDSFECPLSPSLSCPSLTASSKEAHRTKLRAYQTKFTYQKEPRKRTRTTPAQLEILIRSFEQEPAPNSKQRKAIATKTGMTLRAVQVWFQNRRAKLRQMNAASASSSAAAPTPSAPSSSSSVRSPSPSPSPSSSPFSPRSSSGPAFSPLHSQEGYHHDHRSSSPLPPSSSPLLSDSPSSPSSCSLSPSSPSSPSDLLESIFEESPPPYHFPHRVCHTPLSPSSCSAAAPSSFTGYVPFQSYYLHNQQAPSYPFRAETCQYIQAQVPCELPYGAEEVPEEVPEEPSPFLGHYSQFYSASADDFGFMS